MQNLFRFPFVPASTWLLLVGCFFSCAGERPPEAGSVVVYSGRNEKLVGPLLDRFSSRSGLEVRVRYGDTAELAATILEEGRRSPADLFLAQDAGALGALSNEGRLVSLPDDLLEVVEPRFRSPQGLWVGITGRARVVAYHTDLVREEELPESVYGLAEPCWRERLGWVPTNGSFQAFVTALRLLKGDEAAQRWLEGVQANRPRVYASNLAALRAVAAGEVAAVLVNHYYLLQARSQSNEPLKVRNHYFKGGDAGALVNVAGVGVLDTASHREAALELVAFLLSEEAQRYFTGETFEYPLAKGMQTNSALPPLEEIETPRLDLTRLADLRRTLELLQRSGVLR